jgi:hypothetical protein
MGYRKLISSRAEGDVLRERERQHYKEGFSAAHDDVHTRGELALAAAAYAVPENVRQFFEANDIDLWPFHFEWWKPKDRRRDLVRAAALIIAEIERIDRAEEGAKP